MPVAAIFADADMVIILFDATAFWKERFLTQKLIRELQIKKGKAIAFFDTRDFDELWTRVSPVI